MDSLLTRTCIKAYFGTKNGVRRFFTEEKGGAEIIATVVVIGIVLVIAFLFRDALKALFISLWNGLVVKESGGAAKNLPEGP